VLIKIPSLFLLCFLVGCKAPPQGGIVDNGNEPEDGKGTEEPQNKNSDSPGSVADSINIAVLSSFTIDVTSSEWVVENEPNSTVVRFGEQRIIFTLAGAVCDVTPETNQYGIDIYFCDENKTFFDYEGATYIQATHSSQTEDIVTILESLRKN